MALGKKKNTSSNSLPNRRRQQPGDTSHNNRPSAQELSERYAFRRNRTITGSASAQVASSNEMNAELRSPRAHVHHLTSLRRRLLTYLFVVGLGALGLYVLLAQTVATQVFQVKDVPVVNASEQLSYQKAMEEYYVARPVERLRFMLNESRLLSHMQAAHPEVKGISIEQSKIGEADVIITARQPIAKWSFDTSDQFVDGEGVVFAKNYFEAPSLQIVDNSGAGVGTNRLVASNRFLGFVGRLLSSATERGLRVATVTLPSGTTRQVEVALEGKRTKYKVSVDRSAGQQVEDISRIVKYLEVRRLTPGYVDVRLKGKAYYK